MYTSHWHHTPNGVAALPTTLIFMLVRFFVQRFFFFLQITTRPANMHIIFRVGANSKWCTTVLQIVNLSAAVTKKKEREKSFSVKSQNTVENTAGVHRFKSVCSFQGWSMWSVRRCDRSKQNAPFLFTIPLFELGWFSALKRKRNMMITLHMSPSSPESKIKRKKRKCKSSVTFTDGQMRRKLWYRETDVCNRHELFLKMNPGAQQRRYKH